MTFVSDYGNVSYRELLWCVYLLRPGRWHSSISVVRAGGAYEIISLVHRGGVLAPMVGRYIRGWRDVGEAIRTAQTRAIGFTKTHKDGECELVCDVTGAGLPVSCRVRRSL